METVEEILRLEELIQDLAQRRVGLAGRPVELDAVDEAYNAASYELHQLISTLSPEDEAWLEVERAGIRHGVSGERFD